MPGGFPQGMELCGGTDIGTDATNTRGTAIRTDSGSIAVFGTWQQIIASTARDTCWMHVMIQFRPDASVDVLFNIGVGAAGNESAVVSGLMAVTFGSNPYPFNYDFPINIPAGSRISAQAAGSTSTFNETNARMSIILLDGGFVGMEGCAGVEAIGVTSGHGTSITCGAANTKGSYSQLIASTARDYAGFYIAMDVAGSTSFPTGPLMVDVAIGAGGSEQIIVPNVFFSSSPGAFYGSGMSGPFRVPIPAGTRVAARVQDTAGSTVYGIILVAIYQ
jgi:hypothetical protein